MKRCLFVMILIVSLGILFAVESDPSATVGYFKKSVTSGGWEAFSYPFYQTDMSIATLIGDQCMDQDMIVDIGTSFGTTYYDGFGWFGDLEYLVPGSTYWLVRYEMNPGMDYYLMGTVDPQTVTVNIAANSWSSFALNEARNVAIADLPITGMVDQDMIVDVGTSFGTTYYDGFGWFGDLENIEPTHVYWFVTTSTSPISFTYVPGARQSEFPGLMPSRSKPADRK